MPSVGWAGLLRSLTDTQHHTAAPHVDSDPPLQEGEAAPRGGKRAFLEEAKGTTGGTDPVLSQLTDRTPWPTCYGS